MKTVFVTQEVPHRNLTPALEYGRIVTILPSGDLHASPQKIYDHFYSSAEDMEIGDYILPQGDPIGMALCIVAVLKKFGRANVLRYHRETNEYSSHIIENL